MGEGGWVSGGVWLGGLVSGGGWVVWTEGKWGRKGGMDGG